MFQLRGLIGEHGILPVSDYLRRSAEARGPGAWWQVPTIFWLRSTDGALVTVCVTGVIAAALVVVNISPRVMLGLCAGVLLSFATVVHRFGSFQMDALLVEAGFLAVFLAPGGFRPGLGATSPSSRLAGFAVTWLLFRVYFESGLAKLSGDPGWAALTVMDHYYETGPLPTVLAWYAQELLPHWVHVASTFFTLVVETVLVWAVFWTSRPRRVLFCVLTAFQLAIIATANYGALNYLTLTLGIWLLDDDAFAALRQRAPPALDAEPGLIWRSASAALLGWHFYVTTALLLAGSIALPAWPNPPLMSLRLATRFGFFGQLPEKRVELEFQGSDDGEHWVPYTYRFKPQDTSSMPGFFAPYQARFEIALAIAALDDDPRHSHWTQLAGERLSSGSQEVLRLFRQDPFGGHPPSYVRIVRWDYRFSTPQERAADGSFWKRSPLGLFGPVLHRSDTGRVDTVDSLTGL
jgi:hypothetical protein